MILTVGDSVCWGQGLKEEHKLDFLFAREQGLQFTRVAHSGAVIGTENDTSSETEPGEVPVGMPSVWQQVQTYNGWSQVELVLLNGGINDVSVNRILNPSISRAQLNQLVDQFCRRAEHRSKGIRRIRVQRIAGNYRETEAGREFSPASFTRKDPEIRPEMRA
jgi:lysophospholipase L1-like esterase